MSPIYSFICESCKKETEIFCTLRERPEEIVCEECKGTAKLGLSTPNFTINGASYANGYSGPSNYYTLGSKKGKKK